MEHTTPREDLMGSDPAAIKRMKDLSEYYKDNAIEVRNILHMNEAVTPESCSQPLSI